MKAKKGASNASLIIVCLSLLTTALLIVAALILYRGGRGDEKTHRPPIKRAEALLCKNLIKKVQGEIDVYTFENEKYPENLAEIPNLHAGDFVCPITGKAYAYDSTAGKIRCPDH